MIPGSSSYLLQIKLDWTNTHECLFCANYRTCWSAFPDHKVIVLQRIPVSRACIDSTHPSVKSVHWLNASQCQERALTQII